MTAEVPEFRAGPRLWMQLIRHEWFYARSRQPELAALLLPSFAVSSPPSPEAGGWDPRTRTMTLAQELLRGRRWHLLLDILHHEMAHQVVTEAFGRRRDTMHGVAFARACELLEIATVDKPEMKDLEMPQEVPPIVRAVRQQLALSNSTSAREVVAALSRVQELTFRHNLALAESPNRLSHAHRLMDRPRKRWPRWTWAILHICEQLCQVRYIRWSLPDGKAVVELTGVSENLDLAEYLYHDLVQAGETLWRRHREDHQLPNNRRRLAFLGEQYVGLDRKVACQRQELEAKNALVLQPDPGLEAAFRKRHPRTCRRRSPAS